MVFHHIPRAIWRLDALVSVFVMFIVFSFVGEITARYASPYVDPAELADEHVMAARSFDLPNYWMSYDEDALFHAIAQQRETLVPFLLHTAFNAAVTTNVTAVFTVFLVMFLAVRAFPPQDHKLKLVGILPLLAFLCDMGEDFALIFLTLSFPTRLEFVATLTTWLSFFKFASWIGIGFLSAFLFFQWAVAPPRREEKTTQ